MFYVKAFLFPFYTLVGTKGFPGGSDGKESACNVGDLSLTTELGRPTGKGNDYCLLTGEFHGQRSLLGYSPWGHKESDTTLAVCTEL